MLLGSDQGEAPTDAEPSPLLLGCLAWQVRLAGPILVEGLASGFGGRAAAAVSTAFATRPGSRCPLVRLVRARTARAYLRCLQCCVAGRPGYTGSRPPQARPTPRQSAQSRPVLDRR